MVEFSSAYAATNDRDFGVFSDAVGDRRIEALAGY
jgi:hypothetical protein